jgi:hypothetical protein
VIQSGRFDLKAAFWQSFSENLFYHVWRISSDPGLRWSLAHRPFFHDWFASYKGYNMHRWGDGDSFVINEVGHPLEGAVFARTFLHLALPLVTTSRARSPLTVPSTSSPDSREPRQW